jgi:hypothetical protein
LHRDSAPASMKQTRAERAYRAVEPFGVLGLWA